MSEQFEHLLNRVGNGSMKWETAYIKQRFGIAAQEDLYPLFIADMDYVMDQEIQRQMMKLLTQPDFGYFHVQQGYYDSIIAWQQKVHHLTLQKEWILPSIGTITSLNIACDLFANKDGIAILTPVYGSFQKCAEVTTCFTVPLRLNNLRYELDFEALRALFIKETIRILLFCNPHNPGGRVWTREELHELVMLCKEFHVMILSDEIHSDLQVGSQEFVSLFTFCDEYDNLLVSTSPNKTFNLSGLTTSYVLCKNQGILQEYQAYMDRLHLTCNRMGIMMSELCYHHGYDWYLALLSYLKGNIELLKQELANSDMQVMVPQSGYLVWVYLPGVSDIDRFVLELAKETHVLLERGSRFVDHYEGWVRINTATSRQALQEAMKRFVKFYTQVHS